MIDRAEDHNYQRRQIIKRQFELDERARRTQIQPVEENHMTTTSPPKSEATQMLDALFEMFSKQQFKFQKNVEPLIRAEIEAEFNEKEAAIVNKEKELSARIAFLEEENSSLILNSRENFENWETADRKLKALDDKTREAKRNGTKKIREQEAIIVSLQQQVSDLIINKDTQTETDVSYNRLKQMFDFGRNKGKGA